MTRVKRYSHMTDIEIVMPQYCNHILWYNKHMQQTTSNKHKREETGQELQVKLTIRMNYWLKAFGNWNLGQSA